MGGQDESSVHLATLGPPGLLLLCECLAVFGRASLWEITMDVFWVEVSYVLGFGRGRAVGFLACQV